MKKLFKIIIFLVGSIGVLVALVVALDQYQFNFSIGAFKFMSNGFVKEQSAFRLPDSNKEYFNGPHYLELLFDRKYDELSKLCETALLKQKTDLRYDSALVNVLSFNTGMHTGEELLKKLVEWKAKDNKSQCPVMALAIVNMNLGTHESKSSQQYYKDSYNYANQIRDGENTIISYYVLINLAPRLNASKNVFYKLVRQAEEICPQCYMYRRAAVASLAPFWNGNSFEMEKFAMDSLDYIDENPQLIKLKAFSQSILFDSCIFPGPAHSPSVPKEKLKKCLPYLNQAIEIDPDPEYLSTRVEALLRLEDEKVMKDLESLMNTEPEEFKPYYSTAMAHFRAMHWVESSKYLSLHLKNTRWKNKIREGYLEKMLDFYNLELQTKCGAGNKKKLCTEYQEAKQLLVPISAQYNSLPEYPGLDEGKDNSPKNNI